MTISAQKLYPFEVIRQLLVQPPEILRDRPLTVAIAAIQQQPECNCVIVLEADQTIGILTQRNILGLLIEQQDIASLKVQDAVGRSPITYPAIAQMDVVAIQKIFTDQHISHLPIVDAQQQLLGVLTEKKLLNFLNADATRLHLAQETIEEKAALYNQLVEFAPIGIFRSDAAGNCTFVNPELCNILGLNFSDLLGDGWSNFLHPDDRDMITKEWHESMVAQHPFDREYRFLRSDGEVVWVQGRSVAAEYNPEGKVVGSVGSIVDISDRKAAESTLTSILEGTVATIGEDFFAALVTHLARATGCGYAFVNERKGDRLYSLASWEKDRLPSACNYPYKDTPCECVLDDGFFKCLDNVDLHFPKDLDLVAMKVKSYVGIALKNDQAESIGNICVLDQQPISVAQAQKINHILRIFAARASAELLRKRTDEALQQLNQTLEKRVEERTAALQNSEQRLRLITDSVPAAIAYIDTNQRYKFVNRTYAHWFAQEQTNIMGKTVREVLGEELYADCQSNIQRVLHGEKAEYSNLEIKFGERTRYVTDVLVPDYDEQNIVQGYYFFATDISDRHRAELALQESEAELQGLFAAMDDVVLVVSPDGSYTKIIETKSDQFYYPPEELIGQSISDIFSGEQRAFFEDCIQRTFASGISQQFEYSLPIKGVNNWFHATCSLISEDRLLWVARDISDRRRTEEALRDSEQRYLNLMAIVPVGILRLDLDGTVTYANQRAADICGLSVEDFYGNGWQEAIHPDDKNRILVMWQQAHLGQTPIQCEHRFVQPDGSIRWVYVQTMPEKEIEGRLIGTVGTITDITDRKEAEEKVQQSQNILLEAQHIAHIGNWTLDIRTEEIIWSAEVYLMFGLDPSQSAPSYGEWWSRIHPDDQAKLRHGIEQAIAHQIPYVIDYRAILPDGSIRYHEGRAEVETDASGQTIRIFGTALDITDRQLAAIALQESETRWQFALEGSGDGIWDLDLETNQVFFSPQWKAILGYGEDEIENKLEEWDTRIHPEDRASVDEQVEQYLQGEIPTYYVEHRLRCKDGSYKWILTRGKAMAWDDDGIPTRMIGTHTDISDRKKTELAIQEISQRLAIATQSAKIGIWEYNHIKNILIWDEQMYALYDTNPNNFAANLDSWAEKIHPDDRAQNLAEFEAAIANNLNELTQEFRVVHTNGDMHYIKSNAVMIRNEAGEVERLIGVDWEVSDYKQVEKALIQAKDTAETAAQTKSLFLANMSHEIRTPMNGVIGMLHLLQDTELTDQQRSHINIAQSSAESLLSLINDILDFSKVEAGKLAIEHIDFDPHELIGSFARTMALKSQEKGLELLLDLRGIGHGLVNGDPGRLRQILINLTSNAIKFTERGDILLTCRLTQMDSGPIFTGTLTDQGIGIPQDTLDHLFEPFTQMDASTTRKYGGTGLGLAITKKLCKLMGGNITATSEVGKGSQFRFTIELQASNEVRDVPQLPRIAPLKLLLVDDNAVQREILHSQLAAWGVEVTEAASGKAALELFDGRSPTDGFDIVLMDRTLPDMRSFDVGKILWSKAGNGKLSILMMTAIANKSAEVDHLDLDVAAYLTKPIMPSELLNALVNISDGAVAVQRPANSSGVGGKRNAPEAIAYPEKTRLLLVEDNKVNQMVIRGLLKKMGLQISTAMNGVEALWLLRESSPEAPFTCILMDCLMPEMNGYETTQQIREGNAGEQYQSIPIVALTANAMKGDREKCIASGMDDYLTKPINPETMRIVLNQWLLRTNTKSTNTCDT